MFRNKSSNIPGWVGGLQLGVAFVEAAAFDSTMLIIIGRCSNVRDEKTTKQRENTKATKTAIEERKIEYKKQREEERENQGEQEQSS